jgi:hypothetical protein
MCFVKPVRTNAGRRQPKLDTAVLSPLPPAHTFESLRRFQGFDLPGTAAARGALQPEARSEGHYWLSPHGSNQTPALRCSWTLAVPASCV